MLIRGTEFVLALSSEANEICDKESKKTLLPEHILAALKVPPSPFDDDENVGTDKGDK